MTVHKLFNKQTDDQTQDNEFRIGLVMAGAISAGAYTAGVMDFLIEAIQAWEKAKAEAPDNTPSHNVQFDFLAGASAGGMCAGIFASALRDYKKGVRSLQPDESAGNIFYRSWVLEVGYEAMVTLDDLKPHEAPKSVLNVEGEFGLEGIKDRALSVNPPSGNAYPPWLKDPLPIIMSINNLRGVPYSLTFAGPQNASTHGMSAHKDYIHFSLSNSSQTHEDAISLDFNTNGMSTNAWKIFGEATLATGAFPAAFKPRWLVRDAQLYTNRQYSVPNQNGGLNWQSIPPSCPQGQPTRYGHWTIDGGTMNNEPMDLARKALADKTGRNERNSKEASRMLLMIDPFPNAELDPNNGSEQGTLLGSLMALLSGYKSQSRLKIEDLMLFGDENVASRFAISPSCAESRKHPLACASLGAFGGILDKKWRHHDYLLGRLNCQSFLKSWFVVHKDNRIVKDKAPQLNSQGMARIIPLVSGMDATEAAVEDIDIDYIIPWPEKMTKDKVGEISNKFYARLKAVLNSQMKVSKGGFIGWLMRKYVNIGLYFSKKTLKEAISKNLKYHDLM